MDLTALTDLSLLKESREANEKAFNILFERYFNKLYKYTLHHTNNPSLAEELVMDMMLCLWDKQNAKEVKGDASAYLFGMMRNIIYSHFRKAELSVLSLDQLQTEPVAHQVAGGELKEIEEQYKTSLELLTPQRRKVFTLSREKAMTYSEIASHLGLSVKTVEAHLSASLRFMHKRLKDHTDLLLLAIILRLFP